MRKSIIIILIVLLVGAGAYYLGTATDKPADTQNNNPEELNNNNEDQTPQEDTGNNRDNESETAINIEQPSSGAKIQSPLVIKGEARGSWYFEGSFTAALKDANGNEIARSPVQAQGEWMAEDFVPFEATIGFKSPDTEKGMLILEKANPSGRPQNAEMRAIPIKFK